MNTPDGKFPAIIIMVIILIGSPVSSLAVLDVDDIDQRVLARSDYLERSPKLKGSVELMQETIITELEIVYITPQVMSILTQYGEQKGYSIDGGGYREGKHGEIESFLVHDMSFDGHLIDIQVEFSEKMKLSGEPIPFVVPFIIGELPKGITKEWQGAYGFSYEPYFEVMENGKDISIRLFPMEWSNMDLSLYLSAEISYSIRPIYPEVTSSSISVKPTGDTKYLIVTIEDLEDEVIPFAQWKSQKGQFTEIVTIEQLREDYPVGPDPKRIRDHVTSLESIYDLDYLLLIGDHDKVPTRITVNLHPETTYGEPTTFASDSYYACVDQGTSWDLDGDGHHAEVGELDDVHFDLSVGRLAINDEHVLSLVLEGLIERERNISWKSEMADVVHIVGDPHPVPGDPTNTMDHFWDEYLDDLFPSRDTIYYDGSGNMTFSSTSFKSIMGHNPQVMGYFSHGTQTGIPNLFSNNQISTLPSVGPDGSFFLMACLTGWFDDPNQGNMGSFNDCFGETMTETPEKGVVGYMGASRLAFGSIDTQYNGDAPGLEEDYWRGVREAYLGNIPSTTGDIYRYAINHFSTSFSPFPTSYNGYAAQRTFLEYNLLGDPEAPLFLKDPDELFLSFDVLNDNTTVNAHVSLKNGTPVEGALVSIFRWQELGVYAETDIYGNCSITIPPSNGGIVNITAYIPGHHIDHSTFILPDLIAPTPFHTIEPGFPDGLNETYVTRPNVTITADEPSTIYVRSNDIDIGSFVDRTSIHFPEGNNTMSYRAIDTIGHISEWKYLTLNVDITPPELNLITDPEFPDGSDGYFISTPMVSIQDLEQLNDVMYKIDDGYLDRYSGPFMISEGKHSVYIEAKDDSGLFNSTISIFEVDTTGPLSSLEISHDPDGDNGYYITRPMIRIRSYDENQNSSAFYKWNEDAWTGYTSPLNVPLGINRLSYYSSDAAGNSELNKAFNTFKYDPYPPDVFVNITPEVPDGMNETYISIPVVDVHVFDNISERVMEQYVLVPPGIGFEWGVDSIPLAGPITIPEGEWNLFILAQDLAGNQKVMKPIHFSVDITPPSISFGISPEQPDGNNTWYTSSPKLRIFGSLLDNSIFISFDGGDMESITENITLPEGIHDIEVHAIDRSGIKGQVHSFSYKCDLTDPIPIITSIKGIYHVNETILISASSSTDLMGIDMYHFHFIEDNTSTWSKSSNITMSRSTPGNLSIRVEAIDISGRSSISSPLTLQIIPIPEDLPFNETNGTGIVDDPDPNTNIDGDENIITGNMLIGMIIFSVVVLMASIGFILFMRNRNIQEVEWEDDDDWMDADWVDENIEDDGELVSDDLYIME